MNNLAIFASGSGTNAENIIRFFRPASKTAVKLVLTNKKDAGVIKRAESLDIPVIIFTREEFYNSDRILEILRNYQIDLIVLAGFLLLVPENLVKAYPNSIINIHPALLPKYGGKGMYGSRVHEAVIHNGEKNSGITIHYVNEKYDDGNIIFQATCPVNTDDTPDSLAEKVHALEYEHFPKIIEQLLTERG